MLNQDLILIPTKLVPTERQLPAIIQGSGRKARDRIEHFLRAAIDNDNTRRAYGRALGSFFAFLEDGGRERVQDIGPLDVRDYLEAAKSQGLALIGKYPESTSETFLGADQPIQWKHQPWTQCASNRALRLQANPAIQTLIPAFLDHL
jgi:hypothetical protein